MSKLRSERLSSWTGADVANVVLLATAYFVIAFICIQLSRAADNVAFVWFSNALSICWILASKPNLTVPLFVSAFVSNVSSNVVHGDFALTSIGFALANGIEIVITVFAYRWFASRQSMKDLFPRVLAVLGVYVFGATPLGASVGSLIVWSQKGTPFFDVFPAWWLGDTVSAVFVIVPFLILKESGFRSLLSRKTTIALVGAILLCAPLSLFFLFLVPFPFVYITIPFATVGIIWGGALVSLVVCSSFLVFGLFLLLGPFPIPDWVLNPGPKALLLSSAVSALFPMLAGIASDAFKVKSSQLQQSELKFLETIKIVTTGLAVKDADGKYKEVNDYVCSLTGYSRDELIGKSIEELTYIDDAPLARAQLQKLVSREISTYSMEKRVVRKDGSLVWTTIKASLLNPLDNSGEIIVQIDDISEQKQRDEERELAQRELQTIIDHMPAMVGYWNKDLRNRFANKAYVDFFGMNPEEINGKHIRDVLGQQRFELNLPFIQGALHGENQTFERTIVDPRGVPRHTVANYVPHFSDSEVVGFYAFVTDNTSLKAAQSGEVIARLRLQAIIDGAVSFSIISTNPLGIIETFSTGSEMMLGYRKDELVGKEAITILHLKQELKKRKTALRRKEKAVLSDWDALSFRAARGGVDSNEWSYVHKSGAIIPVNVVITGIPDDLGETRAFLAVAVDIRAQKETEASLIAAKQSAEKAARFKSEFLANMSHEIRTPMNAVIGMTALLDNTKLDSLQRHYIQMLRQAGEGLLMVINDVLDYSKIEASKLELNNAVFDLDQVLQSVGSIMAVSIGEKNIEPVIIRSPNIPRFLIGDSTRVKQILVNLVGNAIKFTTVGEVRLEATLQFIKDRKATFRFVVSDTGIGMGKETIESLFKPFSQGDGSITRRFGGTGLGLAITKNLVDLMEGSIAVESTIGRGSRFTIDLSLEIDEHQGTDRALRFARLLLVDTTPSSSKSMTAIAESFGWTIDIVSNAKDAIEAGRKINFDVVAMDIHTLNIDVCIDIVNHLSSTSLPVVFLTRSLAIEALADLRLPNPHVFLQKPVVASTLYDSVLQLFTPLHHSRNKLFADELIIQPRASLSGVRILLAEDNSVNQYLTKSFLEPEGASIEIVENGKLAVDRISHSPDNYDLILMDVQMPIMDGLTASKEIVGRLRSQIPVIALTAGVMENERKACEVAGMTDFIPKPMDRKSAIETILRVIKRRHDNDGKQERVPDTNRSIDVSEAVVFDVSRTLSGVDPASAQYHTIVTVLDRIVDELLIEVERIRHAAETNNSHELGRVLHTFRGNIGNLGADRLVEIVLKSEEQLKSDPTRLPTDFVRRIENESHQLLLAAREWQAQRKVASRNAT